MKKAILGAVAFALVVGCTAVATQDKLSWTQVNTDGFGDPNCTFVSIKAIFDGCLYAGTLNRVAGGGMWRSCDGLSWMQVNSNGFGDVCNAKTIPNVVYGNCLYASTYNETTGTEVWMTEDGTNWTQINLGGFGDRNNVGTERAAVFNGDYYIGTSNDVTGGELWRLSCGVWMQVNEDGFGDLNNVTADPYVFKDHLYVGTVNFETGGELWRSSDGTTWTQVSTDGFGDPTNLETYASVAFKDELYVGVANLDAGVSIWRSSDGTTWTQVSSGGFGDPTNMWGYPYLVFDGNMYLGTGNEVTGTELWRSSDGENWTQVNADGFGDVNSRDSYPWFAFNGALYVGTWNEVTGCEIWRGEPVGSADALEIDFYEVATANIAMFTNTVDVALTGLHVEFDRSVTILNKVEIGGYLPVLGGLSGTSFDFAGKLVAGGVVELDWEPTEAEILVIQGEWAKADWVISAGGDSYRVVEFIEIEFTPPSRWEESWENGATIYKTKKGTSSVFPATVTITRSDGKKITRKYAKSDVKVKVVGDIVYLPPGWQEE